jgi:hypothetical protein
MKNIKAGLAQPLQEMTMRHVTGTVYQPTHRMPAGIWLCTSQSCFICSKSSTSRFSRPVEHLYKPVRREFRGSLVSSSQERDKGAQRSRRRYISAYIHFRQHARSRTCSLVTWLLMATEHNHKGGYNTACTHAHQLCSHMRL